MSVEVNSERSETEQRAKECPARMPKGQWTPNVVSMNIACRKTNGYARYSMGIPNIDKVGFLSHEAKGFIEQCKGSNVCLLAQICQGRAEREGWSALPV